MFRASHNALPNIPSALLQLSSLRVLDLSHNRVRELPPGALTALAGLQELRLAKNKLRELRAGAVERLPRLQVLDLDSNELHSLQARAVSSKRGSPLPDPRRDGTTRAFECGAPSRHALGARPADGSTTYRAPGRTTSPYLSRIVSYARSYCTPRLPLESCHRNRY